MSLEYILAAGAGVVILGFLGLAALLAVIFVVAKLAGGPGASVVVSTPAVDPLAVGARGLLAGIDAGREIGAVVLMDRLAKHSGNRLADDVGEAFAPAPKASPPAK